MRNYDARSISRHPDKERREIHWEVHRKDTDIVLGIRFKGEINGHKRTH